MQDIPKKSCSHTHGFFAQDLLDRARCAGSISRQAEHRGIDSRRNPLWLPASFQI